MTRGSSQKNRAETMKSKIDNDALDEESNQIIDTDGRIRQYNRRCLTSRQHRLRPSLPRNVPNASLLESDNEDGFELGEGQEVV
jgi:hypothetical protein